MAKQQSHVHDIFISAAIGALVGGISLYALTSKSGAKTKKSFVRNCETFFENAEEFVHDLHSTIKESVREKTAELSEKANSLVENAKEKIESVANFQDEDFRKGLVFGSIGGILAAIGTTLVFKTCMHHENEHDVVQNIGSKAAKWKKVIQDVADALNENKACYTHNHSRALHDVLDFATTGFQLWKKLQK